MGYFDDIFERMALNQFRSFIIYGVDKVNENFGIYDKHIKLNFKYKPKGGNQPIIKRKTRFNTYRADELIQKDYL